ncbi:hypothetical protein QOZ80_5BG0452710 [Eleusine coracana subsp. coracana]|nr:hypothetical protein QOZ80_5BG0452710 [Eleusine coracana subsp. coracana]
MVPPLEQAAAAALLNNVMGKLFEALGLVEMSRMLRDLKPQSESLLQDLRMLAAAVDDELAASRGARRSAVARAYSVEMRALTHDVEDCVERFVHRVAGLDGASSRLRRAVRAVTTLRTCYRFATQIKRLKKRVEEARARVLSPPDGGQPSGGRGVARRRTADHAARHPVGIEKPMEELLALLELDKDEGEGHQSQPRVIAIVGFGDVGKTTLARAAYDAPAVADAFPCRAWVPVGSPEEGEAAGILEKIHQQLLPGQQYSQFLLTEYLKDKRYLIVIDDVDDIEEEQWDTITSAFEGNGEGSRILVTTRSQPTANRRSNDNRCVYKMRTLGVRDSMTIALRGKCAAELVQGSETLLKKCDGLPLALVSMARQLSSEDEPTGRFCSELCNKLGSYLEREDGEPNFARLRDVLMDNYTSLSDLSVRTCLLYLGIFPTDRPLKKNVIIRRWLAEGYARSGDITLTEQSVANGTFKTFIDRNIIQPVDKQNNAEVKTCKTHGIMHEFLWHRSMREKFIRSSRTSRDKIVRHLFVHGDVSNDVNSTVTLDVDLSRVRSLTVRGSAGGAISDFGNYKLIRVLDLEDCSDINESHLKKICKLWNLRYLSLGPNITKLPKKISHLQLLETLALSKTVVNLLPLEVIGLPYLTNLIGKFKLPDQNRVLSELDRLSKTEELEVLCRKSKLETLAGFVAHGSQGKGFLQLMVHMKNLKKVKIWCESTGTIGDINSLNNELVKGIRQYTKVPMGVGGVRTLSIDFPGLPRGSMHALLDLNHHGTPLQETYYLSSLKLHGDLSTSHEFVANVSGLVELCLRSTTIRRDLLSALNTMPFLLYLTLITDEFEGFSIKVGTFQSLRRLRFVVEQQNLMLPEIEDGALPELISLQLPCKHLAGPSGINIRRLKKLLEIELHPKVSEPARKEWEAAARYHPNRPNVLPFVSVDYVVRNELTKNSVTPPEESLHEETFIQGQQAEEAPGPSSVQHMPLSTCNNSRFSSEIDDPARQGHCSQEAAIETSVFDHGQLLIKEPFVHIPLPMKQEDRPLQSRSTDILCSTSDDGGQRDHLRCSEAPEKPVAPDESTSRTCIQGCQAEALKCTLVLDDQQGYCTSTELRPVGSCHTSNRLLNTSNGRFQIHANGNVNDNLQ